MNVKIRPSAGIALLHCQLEIEKANVMLDVLSAGDCRSVSSEVVFGL
jgi:hypothetical protein